MAERGRLFSGGRIGINKSYTRMTAATGPFGGKVYYFLPWMEGWRESARPRLSSVKPSRCLALKERENFASRTGL
jgi:hypothetical protein